MSTAHQHRRSSVNTFQPTIDRLDGRVIPSGIDPTLAAIAMPTSLVTPPVQSPSTDTAGDLTFPSALAAQGFLPNLEPSTQAAVDAATQIIAQGGNLLPGGAGALGALPQPPAPAPGLPVVQGPNPGYQPGPLLPVPMILTLPDNATPGQFYAYGMELSYKPVSTLA